MNGEYTLNEQELREVVFNLISDRNYLKIPKSALHKIGIYETIMLMELVFRDHFHHKNPNYDGWFSCTAKQLFKNTAERIDLQSRVISSLIELKLIEKKLMGIPAKNFFRINLGNVANLFKSGNSIGFGPKQESGLDRNYTTNKENIILKSSFFKKTKKEDFRISTPEGVVLPYKRVKNPESKSSDVQGKNKTDKEIKKEEPSTSRGACEGYEKGSSISAATKDINADLKETQVKKSKEKEKPVNTIVPEHLKPFIAVWESQGFKLSDKKTQSFANSIHSLRKLISGSLYKNTGFSNDKIKSYTLSDFIFGIERFKLTLTPDYYPLNKASIQRITLQDFLYNPFTTSKSLFLTMLHEEPKRVRPEVIDYNPTVTTQIISKYRKEVLNNLGYLPSTVDQSKFISAAAKLNTFFEVNSKSFPSLLKDTNKQVDLLWQSIEQETKGMRTSLADITPGFFCSDLTFSRRLPAYLAANGYIKKEGDNSNGKHFSIYR